MKKLILFASILCFAAGLQAANLIPGDSSFETGYGIWNKAGEIVKTETVNGSCAVRLTGNMRSVMLFDLKPNVPHVYPFRQFRGKRIHIQRQRAETVFSFEDPPDGGHLENFCNEGKKRHRNYGQSVHPHQQSGSLAAALGRQRRTPERKQFSVAGRPCVNGNRQTLRLQDQSMEQQQLNLSETE